MKNPRTIVVGTDFTKLSEVAVRTAFALAGRLGAERVHVVHVLDKSTLRRPYPFTFPEADLERMEARREARARERIAEITSDDFEVTHEVRRGIPSRDLPEAAKDAGLLVVASHGYGSVRRALLGSVAAGCVRAARCPVLVVGPGRTPERFDTVVAAVDMSEVSKDVVDLATTYVDADGRVEIVSCIEVPLVIAGEQIHLKSITDSEAMEKARKGAIEALVPPEAAERVRIDVLEKAPVANVILETAELLEADLIVLGSSGHNAWHRMILGSTASRVVSHAPCPVLVVPAGK